MSGSIEGFDELIHDLTAVAGLIPKKVRQAVQQTGMNTKKAWAADARKGSRGRQYAPTIDYETRNPSGFGVTEFQVDVGPNLSRYGGKTGKKGLIPSLGILDDPQGGVNGASPTRARRRAEKFAAEEIVKGLQIALDQSHAAHGL